MTTKKTDETLENLPEQDDINRREFLTASATRQAHPIHPAQEP